MSQIVSFTDYTPPERFDGIPWTQVQIEEADAGDGPWTIIDLVDLDPVDTDPSNPATRNITTANATGPGLWYRLTFFDGNGNSSLASFPIQNVPLGGPFDALAAGEDYVTLEELKSAQELTGTTYADYELETAISAASRLIDDATHRRFYADADNTQVRYYTARRFGDIEIDDLIELAEFATDPVGLGNYTDIWVFPTDIMLDPPNAPADARPWERVVLRRVLPALGYPGSYAGAYLGGGYAGWGIGRYRWPLQVPQAVRVTGQFGWASIPSKVKEACIILAPRLCRRAREAPFGIVGVNAEGGGMRLSQTDPDVCALLKRLTRDQYFD